MFVFYNKCCFLLLLLASGIYYAQGQESKSEVWSELKQSVRFIQEDVHVGFGTNLSGVYTSRFRNQTKMGTGFQLFLGAYLPYSNNLFFHSQLGFAQTYFTHHVGSEHIRVGMSTLELPIFISALLPISNAVETRLLLGWQGNLIIRNAVSGNYPEGTNSIMYTRNELMKSDFGFYFGFAVEYRKWFLRSSGFVGINSIINNDTGMLNTFKLDLGYFMFRKN